MLHLSTLTQYDIEEVQEHCNKLFNQQEIVSLYQRFCQLDRTAKGFISSDEFMSVPEFAMNPLAQRLLKMVDGLNFKDFVAFLSAFSAKASIEQKAARGVDAIVAGSWLHKGVLFDAG
uniref:EF-hand domain-containing protein n=1 Tax=Chenopodium quinoa TaxID=63459 RepID=A0A803MLR2_CHEQI